MRGCQDTGRELSCLDSWTLVKTCGDDFEKLSGVEGFVSDAPAAEGGRSSGNAVFEGAEGSGIVEWDERPVSGRLAGKGCRIVHFVTSGGVFYRIKIMEDAANDKACVVSIEPGRSVEELSAMESSALSLTSRERDVLDLVTRGYTNAEIAKELCVSLSTVKSHLRTMYTKCGVSNRTGLVNRFFDAVFC